MQSYNKSFMFALLTLTCSLGFLTPLHTAEPKKSLLTRAEGLRMAQGAALIGVGVTGLARVFSQDQEFNTYARCCANCIVFITAAEYSHSLGYSLYKLLMARELTFTLDVPLLIGSALGAVTIDLISTLKASDSTTQARYCLAATGLYGAGLLASILYHRWKSPAAAQD